MTQQETRIKQVPLEQFDRLGPEDTLRFAFKTFGDRAAIGTSLQKTGLVLVDMASRLEVPFRVFFVDTLMNYEETYELLDEVEKRYGIEVERFGPRAEDVEALKRSVGQYAHFLARESCCRIRKILPLQRALGTMDVWISGLRSDQSAHRRENAVKAQWALAEDGRELLKLNPLLDWTAEDVDRYTRENNVPCNKLYEYESEYGERFGVIGCAPCHIPVREEFGRRAGKFPWEAGKKECGLHSGGSGI